MEEKEISNIYAIPANYTDSGKLLGGMVEPRNAVETGFLLFLVGAPELLWIPTSGTIRVVVMTVTLLPLGVVSLMGVDGGLPVPVPGAHPPVLGPPAKTPL